MAWARFMDMHSGGGQKLQWSYIYIETVADDNGDHLNSPARFEAERTFYSKLGRNPNRITCTCCGEDYSISVDKTLREVTAYNRGCAWSEEEGYIEKQDTKYKSSARYQTLDEYLESDDIRVIPFAEITQADREQDLPEEGYVWR